MYLNFGPNLASLHTDIDIGHYFFLAKFIIDNKTPYTTGNDMSTPHKSLNHPGN